VDDAGGGGVGEASAGDRPSILVLAVTSGGTLLLVDLTHWVSSMNLATASSPAERLWSQRLWWARVSESSGEGGDLGQLGQLGARVVENDIGGGSLKKSIYSTVRFRGPETQKRK
jgi:hypothetical protein